uniref:Uncharacterized protein n=1 Tax=Arundo donax TaxID=35708 RepID=A0A0A8Y8P0_ARUDO
MNFKLSKIATDFAKRDSHLTGKNNDHQFGTTIRATIVPITFSFYQTTFASHYPGLISSSRKSPMNQGLILILLASGGIRKHWI